MGRPSGFFLKISVGWGFVVLGHFENGVGWGRGIMKMGRGWGGAFLIGVGVGLVQVGVGLG